VARYDDRGCAIPTNLLDAAAWHYAVVATCRKCRAEGVFDPHALWNLFDEKGWDVGVRSAAHRLRCKRCGAGAFVSFSDRRVVTVHLPMPSEEKWKQVMRRLRS